MHTDLAVGGLLQHKTRNVPKLPLDSKFKLNARDEGGERKEALEGINCVYHAQMKHVSASVDSRLSQGEPWNAPTSMHTDLEVEARANTCGDSTTTAKTVDADSPVVVFTSTRNAYCSPAYMGAERRLCTAV